MSKKIVITGANGFIGSNLTEYLANKGHEIYALVHYLYKAPPENIIYRAFDLHSFGSDVIPEGTDIVIHAAYIPYRKGSMQADINYKATKRLYDLSKRKGVKQFIFLSSLSAQGEALSHYGKSKFATAELFNIEKDLVLEPGLVLGNGGLYKQIRQIINKNNLIPLIGGGKQSFQSISITDLQLIIEHSINQQISGKFTIAESEPIIMKDLYLGIAKNLGKQIKFITLPYWITDIIFNIIDKFNIKLGVNKENYLGLKQMKYRKVCDSENVFGVRIKSLEDSLEELNS